MYDQEFAPNALTYSEHATDRLVLATNSGWQQVNLGGVTTGEHMTLKTDRAILVAINATTTYVPVSKFMQLVTDSLTALYLKNESTTNTATIEVAVTD